MGTEILGSTVTAGVADHHWEGRMTVAAAVGVLPRRMADWAARRSLPPNALTGIGLACSLCAAGWFTAGTRSDAAAGGLALCVGYLARRIRVQLVEVGETTQGGAPAVAAVPLLASHGYWLANVCAAAGELAVYAGLAAGARASQRHGIWLLVTEAAIILSVRQVARLCRPAAAGARPPRSSLSLVAGQILVLPTGERTIVIAVTAPLWGARITFLALVAWGAAAAVWVVAQGIWVQGDLTVSDPALSGPAVSGLAVSGLAVSGLAVSGLAVSGLAVSGPAVSGPAVSGPAGASGMALPGAIAACRDDGPVARLAGRIVRGQLVPLPPALAGLAGIAMLAALGLGNLTGILALAPVAAMLLGAAGAGHPHDGRLDWLVPPVLLATQFIYLAALGFSTGAPGPVTFLLTIMVVLRQLDVVCRARRPAGWPAEPAGLGWDGRILIVGLGALLGLVTFAYLGVTAYLGLLLCRVSLSGWRIVREPDISEGERR